MSKEGSETEKLAQAEPKKLSGIVIKKTVKRDLEIETVAAADYDGEKEQETEKLGMKAPRRENGGLHLEAHSERQRVARLRGRFLHPQSRQSYRA